MPTLTVVPNPTPPGLLVSVIGSGFANARTRLLLDGAQGTINTFHPKKDMSFAVGITVSSTPKTQTLIAQQLSGNTWTEKARTSIFVQSVVAPTAPGVPLSLAGVAGDTTVNLTWAAPTSNGGATITGYRVYKDGTLYASPVGPAQAVTGLTNGVAYAFTVSALNSVGEGVKTSPLSLTPVGVPSVTTIQAALDAAAPGATVTIPAGIYRESITITKPVTLVGQAGAIIDGRDSGGNLVRQTWAYINANDVTIRGFTMRYAAGVYATGSVENAVGVQRFTLDSCDISFSYVNVNLTGAINSTISNCSIHDAKHLGVRVSAPGPELNRGQNNVLIGNRIYHNNRVGEPDPGADGGNLKATGQDGLIMDGNEVYDSGKGLWCDVWCRTTIYRNNRIHDNDGPAIHDETSTGSKIYNNVIWANGLSETWGWGAGVLVAACKDTEVYNNTLAWNKTGISFISQQRSDDPGMTGNYSHDNFVAEEQEVAGKERFGEFWAYDYTASILYLPSSNNRGLNDKFYYANPDGSSAPENQYPRFIWDGYRTLATFQTVPGGQGASYVSQSSAVATLTAAGLPLHP